MKKEKIIPLHKLKEVRIRKDLTLSDMAKKLNMSKSMYDYIEKGIRRLSYEDSIRISKIFDLNPDDLFYDDYKEFFKNTFI